MKIMLMSEAVSFFIKFSYEFHQLIYNKNWVSNLPCFQAPFQGTGTSGHWPTVTAVTIVTVYLSFPQLAPSKVACGCLMFEISASVSGCGLKILSRKISCEDLNFSLWHVRHLVLYMCFGLKNPCCYESGKLWTSDVDGKIEPSIVVPLVPYLSRCSFKVTHSKSFACQTSVARGSCGSCRWKKQGEHRDRCLAHIKSHGTKVPKTLIDQ